MNEAPLSFEKAFERLEKILEAMNSGKIPLEEALKLFEEGEKLLRFCHEALHSAEQKIEILMKERQGQLALNAQQMPKTEPFARNTTAPSSL